MLLKEERMEDKSQKPQWSYLPVEALNEVAIAWHLSNSGNPPKYKKGNWMNNPDISWTSCLDSLQRHKNDFVVGKEVDSETGRHALAHLICRGLMLLQMSLHSTGNDDRYKEAQ